MRKRRLAVGPASRRPPVQDSKVHTLFLRTTCAACCTGPGQTASASTPALVAGVMTGRKIGTTVSGCCCRCHCHYCSLLAAVRRSQRNEERDPIIARGYVQGQGKKEGRHVNGSPHPKATRAPAHRLISPGSCQRTSARLAVQYKCGCRCGRGCGMVRMQAADGTLRERREGEQGACRESRSCV